MIIIKNKRCKLENIRKEYPGAIIFDVTSTLKTLSPFYPHGDIPVFGSDKGWRSIFRFSREILNTIL